VNFMGFLGWNPGDEREIYSLASLVKEFSLERVQRSGAVFNLKRLDFLNGFYIRQKSIERLTELSLPFLVEAGLIEEKRGNPGSPKKVEKTEKLEIFEKEPAEYKIKETGEEISFETLKEIVSLYQERLKKISEIVELADFFFKRNLEYDKDLLKWKEMSDKEIKEVLDLLLKILSKVKEGDWNRENLENTLLKEAEKKDDRGEVLWPLRVALTGKEASAGPFEIIGILGKEKTISRLKEAKEKL
jgi:nondiscriminating glutamyl-tRNA synthetase